MGASSLYRVWFRLAMTDRPPNPPAVTMTDSWAEVTAAEFRDRAGEDAFSRAGADVAGMDGPPQAAEGNREYRRHLHLPAQRP